MNTQTITIPQNLIKEKNLILLSLKEYKQFLDFKKVISNDQSWFWTKEWQEKEKEADEDLKNGEYKEFKNVKDLIKDLHQ